MATRLPVTATWKTRQGDVIQISDMETRHLFFSVRMLWNHFCPEELRLEPYKRYQIRMTEKYILSRLAFMLSELRHRYDLADPELKEHWIEQLKFMTKNSHKFTEQELIK